MAGVKDPIRHCRHYDNISDDKRSWPARDKDRVLYSSEFRRLAGVTQVVSPQEAHLFHSRLTHSLEVAQIGRRIAERFLIPDTRSSGTTTSQDIDKLMEVLDPDVIEAACLIHDMGHPPFGHIGEEELDSLVKKEGNLDGFEGNAQSFRIITRLAVHKEDYNGLDLCRATLNATLKYPWKRDLAHPNNKKYLKFGAYTDDEDYFNWVRQPSTDPDVPCLEAKIMDFADDIANAVHDIVDFHRAGLLPLALLHQDDDVFDSFVQRWADDKVNPIPSKICGIGSSLKSEYKEKFKNLLYMFIEGGEYSGTKPQRARIRNVATTKIKQYDNQADIKKLAGNFSFLPNEDDAIEISFLKRVFFDYLISNPRLTTQQYGQRQIIRSLFSIYFNAAGDQKDNEIIPNRFRHLYEALGAHPSKEQKARLAADIVSSLTDAQAYALFGRLNGISPGEISDIVVW